MNDIDEVVPTPDVADLFDEAEELKKEFGDEFDLKATAEFARDNADSADLQTLREAHLYKKLTESPITRDNIQDKLSVSFGQKPELPQKSEGRYQGDDGSELFAQDLEKHFPKDPEEIAWEERKKANNHG